MKVFKKKIGGTNYLYFRGNRKEKVLANLDKKTVNKENLYDVLTMINEDRQDNLNAIANSFKDISDANQRKEFALHLLIFLLSNPVKDKVLNIVGDSGLTIDDVRKLMPEGVDKDIYKKVIDTMSYQ